MEFIQTECLPYAGGRRSGRRPAQPCYQRQRRPPAADTGRACGLSGPTNPPTYCGRWCLRRSRRHAIPRLSLIAWEGAVSYRTAAQVAKSVAGSTTHVAGREHRAAACPPEIGLRCREHCLEPHTRITPGSLDIASAASCAGMNRYARLGRHHRARRVTRIVSLSTIRHLVLESRIDERAFKSETPGSLICTVQFARGSPARLHRRARQRSFLPETSIGSRFGTDSTDNK